MLVAPCVLFPLCSLLFARIALALALALLLFYFYLALGSDQLRDQRGQRRRYWPPFAPWVQ